MNNGFIVCGDTHGNHNYIRYMIRTPDINNTTLFHVGDFGIGFKNEHVDIAEMERLNEALEYKNNHLYVIRGNHDKPEWFDGTRDWSNLHLVPDYTIIDVNGFGVLMVGGAISIDRKPRLYDMQMMAKKGIDKELYWYDENFVLELARYKTPTMSFCVRAVRGGREALKGGGRPYGFNAFVGQ